MDLAKIVNSFTYSFTTSPVVSDFRIGGVFALSNTSSQLQYGFVNLNKTNNLTCVGLICPTCITTASCTSLGGSVNGAQCIKCSVNQVFSIGSGCICRSGLLLIGGVCGTCPLNSIYVSFNQSCVSCGNNAISINGNCVCNDGFFNISGNCQRCPVGTLYNGLSKIC
jgi:hypothetical protein